MSFATPLFAADLFHHVVDGYHISWLENFEFLGIHLPPWLSKYMLLEVIAALLILLIYLPIARSAKNGGAPKGFMWNTFEVLLTFVREKIAKPTIGEHDADKYVSFLWTIFLFVLFCNLLGMIPGLGSPTGSLAVTGVLALFAFLLIHGSAIAKLGFAGYCRSYVPHLGHLPFGLTIPVTVLVSAIEVLSALIKGAVLAIRLFGNMFAGHLVLSSILGFIAMSKFLGWYLFAPITVGSILIVIGVSLLEIFVGFLQAYVFTFLTSLFLGSALHPHH
ncbi:MAG: F0F1 ATP synthase subunit A [Planctomycetia bacterium]|nr:F0F1 ATP synthase subunit A [Planctomycetia bacterium]